MGLNADKQLILKINRRDVGSTGRLFDWLPVNQLSTEKMVF